MDKEITVKCENFDWETLLERIKKKKVIPVIGQGIFRIKSEDESPKLLYDFLADQVLKASGKKTIPDEYTNFAQACNYYFEEKHANYQKLIELLEGELDRVELVSHAALSKLAEIGAFNVFFTTTYDRFLSSLIARKGNTRVESLSFTLSQKRQSKVSDELFSSIKNNDCSLIYHLLGKIEDNVTPAFYGKETLETVMAFQRNLEVNYDLNLLRLVEGCSFLFIGCGYDELLFQSFIRCFAKQPNRISENSSPHLFIGGHINGLDNPLPILPDPILKNYNVEAIEACSVEAFIDCLYERLGRRCRELIIDSENSLDSFRIPECLQQSQKDDMEYSPDAFISFHGGNRKAAERLVDNLINDGIKVWYDEIDLEPGDDVDEIIEIKINECPVFIPLISEKSQKLSENGDLRYHCKEWEQAYSNQKAGQNPQKILPVVIDKTDWKYERFKRLFHTKIPHGRKGKGYDRVLDKLLKIKKGRENTSRKKKDLRRKLNS